MVVAPAKLVQVAESQNVNPGNLFEPFTLELADYAMKLPPDARPKALAVFKETEAQVDAFMANYDAWLTPVLALPPVRLGELRLGRLQNARRAPDALRRLYADPQCGWHARHVGAARHEPGRTSIGGQFAAAPGREDLLYALAYELEAAQPWASRTPNVWMG